MARPTPLTVLRKLLAWEALQGGWEAPAWNEAKAFIRDLDRTHHPFDLEDKTCARCGTDDVDVLIVGWLPRTADTRIFPVGDLDDLHVAELYSVTNTCNTCMREERPASVYENPKLTTSQSVCRICHHKFAKPCKTHSKENYDTDEKGNITECERCWNWANYAKSDEDPTLCWSCFKSATGVQVDFKTKKRYRTNWQIENRKKEQEALLFDEGAECEHAARELGELPPEDPSRRTPDQIMEDFRKATIGRADIDPIDPFNEAVADILHSVKLAVAAHPQLDEDAFEDVLTTVGDYVTNHYGDS